ncbi:MAG: MFS transporter [Dermatophilaceae bacterium]
MGRRFWVVWTAGSISFLGDGLTAGALPLLAVSLTDDARLISLVDALAMLGWLLLGLVSGVVVDRVDRILIMGRVDAVRALITAVFAGLVIAGRSQIWVLLATSLLLGLAAPFFDNASSSLLPELVPPELFEKANSSTQVSMMLATSLLGPPIGAVLFTAYPGAPFGFDAVSFACASLLVLRVRSRSAVSRRRPAQPGAGTHAETQAGAWHMLRAGLAYLVRDPTLRTLALAVGAVNTVVGGIMAVFVLYVTQDLGLPGPAYGWLLATFAIGGVLGSLVTSVLVRRIGQRACSVGSLVTFGVVAVMLGAVPSTAAVVVVLIVGGAASMVWNVVTISYRQRVVPSALLGRVTSAYRMIAFLGMPLGAAAAGLLSHQIGTPHAYLAGGVALLVTALLAAPELRGMPGARPLDRS